MEFDESVGPLATSQPWPMSRKWTPLISAIETPGGLMSFVWMSIFSPAGMNCVRVSCESVRIHAKPRLTNCIARTSDPTGGRVEAMNVGVGDSLADPDALGDSRARPA